MSARQIATRSPCGPVITGAKIDGDREGQQHTDVPGVSETKICLCLSRPPTTVVCVLELSSDGSAFAVARGGRARRTGGSATLWTAGSVIGYPIAYDCIGILLYFRIRQTTRDD